MARPGLRCLLTAVNPVTSPYPVYPLGLASVAGALVEGGHQVEQLDFLAAGEDYFRQLEETMTRFQPELIGISIRNLDLEDSGAPAGFMGEVQETVARIRAGSRAPLVLGGPAFSLAPEPIMRLLGAEYGVVGEGERAVVQLADALRDDRPPQPGIIRRDPEKNPWHHVEYSRAICPYYLRWGGTMNLQTKRGCPHRCSYCSYPLLEGTRIRRRDPDEVAEEAIRLQQLFDARYLFFTDSVFNDPGEHYLEVCEALVKRNNQVPWSGYFRPATLPRTAMALMKRAGLDTMEIGTDSGCDRTLAALNKGFSFDRAVAMNELAAEFEIPCAHFFIFGGPAEDEHTLKTSLANIEKLRPAVVFAFNGIRILPRTAIQRLAVAEGIIHGDDELLEPKFYHSSKISPKKIDMMVKKAWQGRSDRIYPVRDELARIRRFHAKGYSGPIWDKIIRMELARRRATRP